MAPTLWGCGGKFTGGGDTDCTLSAEHIAAGSNSAVPSSTCSRGSDGGLMTGPITSELVGMEVGGTARKGGTGWGRSNSWRLRAYLSRAVIGFKPKVGSIRARLEQCWNGPPCATPAGAHQVGHYDRRYPEPQLLVVGDQLPVCRGTAVARVYNIRQVRVVDDHRWRHVVIKPPHSSNVMTRTVLSRVAVVSQRVRGRRSLAC